MSVQAITWALSVRTRSAAHKAVLLVLANYANDVAACWPSQQTIAAEACCSARTVRTILAHLEDDNLIGRQARRRTDGTNTSDRIVLAVEGPAANLAAGKSDQRQDSAQPAANPAGHREDKPLFEPTNDPSDCVVSPRGHKTDQTVKQRCLDALGPGAADPKKTQGLHTTANCISAWLRHGCELEVDVLPIIAALTAQPRASPVASWKFFEAAVYQARDLRVATPPPESPILAKTPSGGANYGKYHRQSALEQAAARARAKIRAAAADVA